MVDLAITASQVIAGADADFFQGLAGETLTAGQCVYVDSVIGRVKRADADASLQTAAAIGITLHAALLDQPIRLQTHGSLTLGAGAAPAVGTIYVVSGTAGGLAPHADLSTGEYCTILGVGGTGNTLKMAPFVSNQQVP